jgi:hypothetical protein
VAGLTEAKPCRAIISCRRSSIRPSRRSRRKLRRRRRVGYAEGASATDETAETDEAGTAAPVHNAALPQHSRPIEAVERRNASTTGKLSEDTLKALLAAQEESGQGGD